MNIQMDLILPPIVIGMLILLILTLNNTMMESQNSNRLAHEMQSFANNTIQLLQEELREIQTVVVAADTLLRYVTFTNDTVSVFRTNRNLTFQRRVPAGTVTLTQVPARLTDIRFTMFTLGGVDGPPFLRVRVETASVENEEVSGTPGSLRAFAEKDFYLRNIDL